jgi:hypothetical protein
VSGISYLVDERGEKKSVVIDLARHGKLWEDFYDTLVVKSRKAEPRESLEEVEKRFAKRSRG